MNPNSILFRGSVLAEWVSRTLFVGIIILFVFGGFAYSVCKKTFDQQLEDKLLAIASLSASQLKPQWLPYLTDEGLLYHRYRNSLLDDERASGARNLFILDHSGRVLADANREYDFMETDWLKDLDPTPFEKAWQGTPSASILFPEKNGGIYKIAYTPIFQGSRIVAVLGVEASANYIDGLNHFAKILFVSGILCLFPMGGLLYAFGRRFIVPIEQMARASQRISEGDFSQRIRVSAGNELGALAYAFNEMARRLERHNEYILESMSNGLLVLDLNGTVTTFNRAASQIFEISPQDAIGQNFKSVFKAYPTFVEAVLKILHEKLNSENDEVNLSEDFPKFIRLRSTPLLGAGDRILGTEFLLADETEVRKLQAQIKNSEKMATIGELAAGIAHEIRNPLGAMKGFSEILGKKLKSQPENKEIVDDIASEIEILNKIVTNFLIFAKPTALELQEAELNEVIHNLLPLLEKEAKPRKVRIVFHAGSDLLLNFDIDQFRRALLNLVLNAIQASPKESTVKIHSSNFTRIELLHFLSDLGIIPAAVLDTASRWAVVWIEDQGPGIEPENLKKLFTPFFTTKTEGFGLGLSITKKIMEALGGDVVVANGRAGGAIFVALIPFTQ